MERGRDGEIEKGVEGEVWMERGETERLRKVWRERCGWRGERRRDWERCGGKIGRASCRERV